MEEWKSDFTETTVNPQDDLIYEIPSRAISYSKKVLMDYGKRKKQSEGMLYWAGTKNGNTIQIDTVIYPKLRRQGLDVRLVLSPTSRLWK